MTCVTAHPDVVGGVRATQHDPWVTQGSTAITLDEDGGLGVDGDVDGFCSMGFSRPVFGSSSTRPDVSEVRTVDIHMRPSVESSITPGSMALLSSMPSDHTTDLRPRICNRRLESTSCRSATRQRQGGRGRRVITHKRSPSEYVWCRYCATAGQNRRTCPSARHALHQRDPGGATSIHHPRPSPEDRHRVPKV